MLLRSSFVLLALACAAHTAAAQALDPSEPVTPGTRVRVTAPLALDAKRVTGTLVSIDRAHAVVQQDGFAADQTLDIPIEKLDRMEVSRGRVAGGRGVARGALVGATVGAAVALGLSEMWHVADHTTKRWGFSKVGAATAGGAGVGLVAGSLIGAAGYERWKVVHVPGQTLAVHPTVDGNRIGLALALPRRAGAVGR